MRRRTFTITFLTATPRLLVVSILISHPGGNGGVTLVAIRNTWNLLAPKENTVRRDDMPLCHAAAGHGRSPVALEAPQPFASDGTFGGNV